MTVAVTGGAGFIGSHLVDTLLHDGQEVIVIDDLSFGNKLNINKKASFLLKDIRDDLSNVLKDVDTVFHFAADGDVRRSTTNPIDSFDINVRGTINLLESCRKYNISNILFASSSAVYGEPASIPTTESSQCHPVSNYGAAKLACESYLSSFSNLYGIRTSSIRFANIFGERCTKGVMHDIFHKLKKNPKYLQIMGNGKQMKSYLYIADAISATMKIWDSKSACKYSVYNVGSSSTKTVDELASSICAYLSVSPEMQYAGDGVGWIGDIGTMHLDTKKIEALGWKQQFDFETGLKNYLDYLQDKLSDNSLE